MNRVLTLFRHALARYRVHCLTIRLSDAIDAADDCRTEAERIANSINRRILGRELVHARMRLGEFSAPGVRQAWEIA